MVPSNMPPQQQNVEIVLLHDARAVHDIAVIGLAAYLSDGPPWIVALATPGPRSGKATTPGAYIDGKTGKVVMPPSPQTVVMKQGTWQVVAGGQGRQEYAWNEPMERKRVPAPEDQYSPFIHGGDVLFRPAAAVYGSGALAVVLTGIGSDGMIGARLIREQGGSVLAQDQASSIVWGMPGSVATAGLAHKVLPLNLMASEIIRLSSRTHTEPLELRERVG